MQVTALPPKDVQGLGHALMQEITNHDDAVHPTLFSIIQRLKVSNKARASAIA